MLLVLALHFRFFCFFQKDFVFCWCVFPWNDINVTDSYGIGGSVSIMSVFSCLPFLGIRFDVKGEYGISRFEV